MKKHFYILFLISCLAFSQENFKTSELQTGRRTGCYGSGACVFTTSDKTADSNDKFAAYFSNNTLLLHINLKLLNEKEEIAILT